MRARSRLYFYPYIDHLKEVSPNPYVKNFRESIGEHFQIANRQFTRYGSVDLFKYFFAADIFILNWVENISKRRFAYLQVCLLQVFLGMARFLGKKVVWVLHNANPHDGSNKLSRRVQLSLAKHAQVIITHSNAGAEVVDSLHARATSKLHVMHHPIEGQIGTGIEEEKQYDLLIWGTFFPYKGADFFLNFLKDSSRGEHIRVLLIGICPDVAYRKKLIDSFNKNVDYVEKALSLEEITFFASKARYILFTYQRLSVLSSGALMDSLRMNAAIIAPNIGSFRDLADIGLVDVYRSWDDVLDILEKQTSMAENLERLRRITAFAEENSWPEFAKRLTSIIKDN